MPVKSNSSSSFIYKKQRFTSLRAAESKMRGESITHARLKQQLKESSDSEVRYSYAVPIEPYVNAGPDKTLICGETLGLESIITGVPIENLDIEWEQLSGSTAIISNPHEEDTNVVKQIGDNSDKAFSVKVTNRETGVINSDSITVLGTPTDKVKFDGAGFGVRYVSDSKKANLYFSAISTEIPDNEISFQSTDIGRIASWEPPEDGHRLKQVELLENHNGTYVTIGIAPAGTNYIVMPIGRNKLTVYKLRFVYDFNGIIESIDSNRIYIESIIKSSIAHDRVSGISGSMGAYESVLTRAQIESRIIIDSMQVAQHGAAMIGELGIEERQTKEEKITISSINLAQHGSVLRYVSSLTRQDKGDIGGG